MNKHSHQSLKSDFYLVWYWWYTIMRAKHYSSLVTCKDSIVFLLDLWRSSFLSYQWANIRKRVNLGKANIKGSFYYYLSQQIDLAASSHPISMKPFSFLHRFQLNFFFTNLFIPANRPPIPHFQKRPLFGPKVHFWGLFMVKIGKKFN